MTIEEAKYAAVQEALPCPFEEVHGVVSREPMIDQDEDDFCFWWVSCGCGARGPSYRSSDVLAGCAGAVRFWNARSKP